VRPFVLRLQGVQQALPRRSRRAPISLAKGDKRREFLRVRYNDAAGWSCSATRARAC
jgi:molybdopterin molybdotransferase